MHRTVIEMYGPLYQPNHELALLYNDCYCDQVERRKQGTSIMNTQKSATHRCRVASKLKRAHFLR